MFARRFFNGGAKFFNKSTQYSVKRSKSFGKRVQQGYSYVYGEDLSPDIILLQLGTLSAAVWFTCSLVQDMKAKIENQAELERLAKIGKECEAFSAKPDTSSTPRP